MIYKQIKKDIEEVCKKLGIKYDSIEISRSASRAFGDFSTNIAMKSAGENKQSPMKIAELLTDSLKKQSYYKELQVAGSGFINFWVDDKVWQQEVEKVLKEKEKFGLSDVGKGKKARVEFVSANPTGPLHFGNARGGPIGDVLAAVLEFSGYKVLREFYANDIGGQVQKLGQSILNVAKGQKLEDQEYKGEYVVELSKKISEKLTVEEVGAEAADLMLAQIEEDCRDMGINFDVIYLESHFIADGHTRAVLETLEKKKMLKKKEGATWFAPNDEFLKDRETVVVKSDGSYTYFANDIVYHGLKFGEGYDLVIDVLGANHHGHVPRLQAAISALGFEERNFKVILYQWVRFKSKGKILGMSKRSGNFITAREVLELVGKDALRFFILMHDASSHIDFDLDLAREKSSKNPVYYVQYAHARICSILGKASGPAAKADYGLLTTDYELDLIKQISRLPELVEDISQNFAVNTLTTYAMELADSFHKFYENCQVIGENKKLSGARLGLVTATKIALENTLSLLGVSAPEKM